MKLKVIISQKLDKNEPITCIGWNNAEEVFSISDANDLISWSTSNNSPNKITHLNKDIFAIDMQFMPKINQSLGRHSDLILVTTADGKFHLMNKNGGIERSVDAHKGAVLVCQWSSDGTGFLTGGEDGNIKIWSRNGMLRSTIVCSENSVYGATWSSDNQSIMYTQGKNIVSKQLAPNTKPLKWKAHEGLVLCLAFSPNAEILVSGGEDCKYRVWDTHGRPIFSSVHHHHSITSVAWAPSGHLFAIGSYDTVRLCDASGWSRCLEKPNTGTIYKISWSNDSTQFAGACANGHVFFAHIIERHVHYLNYSGSLTERKTIIVKNSLDDTTEYLELPERIIQMVMRYQQLVLTTPSQCFIYNTNNWNTPFIFDLKDGTVIYLELAEKHMLLVERNAVEIYNYQGKLVGQPKWPNMHLESLKASFVSISNDTLVVRDINDTKLIHMIDLSNNRYTNESTTVQHTAPIIELALDQSGPAHGRILAVLDKAHDLHIIQIRSVNKIFSKLSRKIDCFQWSATTNNLAAIQESQLVVWYCPTAVFNPKLLKLCSFYYDASDLGRTPRISDFIGNSVSIRRADGSLINVALSPFPEMIKKKIEDNKWTEALDLCRNINDNILWACLAVLATQSSSETIDIAEEAFANINYFDKVLFIQHIKTLPTKAEQKAHLLLLGGKFDEAESTLLHNGMLLQAVFININLHKWTRLYLIEFMLRYDRLKILKENNTNDFFRALDLAIKQKSNIDTVLFLRDEYLKMLGKTEDNQQFLKIKESITIDPEKIKMKISKDLGNYKSTYF